MPTYAIPLLVAACFVLLQLPGLVLTHVRDRQRAEHGPHTPVPTAPPGTVIAADEARRRRQERRVGVTGSVVPAPRVTSPVFPYCRALVPVGELWRGPAQVCCLDFGHGGECRPARSGMLQPRDDDAVPAADLIEYATALRSWNRLV